MRKELSIAMNVSVRFAMQQMNDNAEKILFIINEKQQLLGSLSDGDIRRWILSEGSLEESVEKIYNRNPVVINESYDTKSVQELMLSKKVEWIPVVNKDKMLTEVLLWENIFGKEAFSVRKSINNPVVIMAGGKGNRLDPFTRILPKALIPIKEKPIIEIIIERFAQCGAESFFISLNHKSKMIKAYFEEMNSKYHIQYLQEEKPLGTAGSLSFLEGRISGSFFLTNCDVLVEADYSRICEFHQDNNYEITIISSYKHYVIPYGVCDIESGGVLKELREKPESNLLVNTGVYLLKEDVIKYIPANKFYLMTDLIKDVKRNGGKVGVYPIGEKSWVDVGQWEEYKEAIKRLGVE